MNDCIATRIYRKHYHLIKQLSPIEQGQVLVALCDYVFQNKNQIEIQNENQFEFDSVTAKSLFETLAPLMRTHTNRAGGARKGAGRPRKYGNMPPAAAQNTATPKNQIEIQNENQNKNQIEIQNDIQIDFSEPTARVSDNNKNNIINTRKPPLVLLPNGNITEGTKENPTKWDLFAEKWNAIAKLYKRPCVRSVSPALQNMIKCRCRENKLTLTEFLQICEKALKYDKNLRFGTDTWRGADLTYFARPLNFQRAIQIADNGIISPVETSETARVLNDFMNGGNQ